MIATKIDDVCIGIKIAHRDKVCKYGIHRGYKIITFDENEKIKEFVELRIAFSPEGTAYACLWVHGNHCYSSGSGMASGCGYCKASAASEIAINATGYQLSENISGVGYGAIRKALIAIAETLTDNQLHVIEMCS